MKEFLNKIRNPDKNMKTKNKIINSFFILLLGIVLGIFSKWLDNMSIDDTIWWQNILGILDLGNVFLFFIGMTVSYHLYTIYFCGFNPMQYMMIWYGITLISPILAYICWYAKSTSKISTIICSLILCVMFISSFSIGIWYFDFNSTIDLIIFIGTVLVLNVKPKNTICSLIIAFVLSFIVCATL